MSNEVPNTKADQQDFWQMAIETWQASGLSVRQFCKQEGLSLASFYSWRKKLRNATLSCRRGDAHESAAFIEVSLPQGHSQPVLELVLSSGNILRIPRGVDGQTLYHTLSALREAHLC